MSTKTAPAPSDAAPAEEKAKGGGKKKILLIVLVLALVAGAAWFFLLRPSGEAEPEAVPGEVLVLEPVQINLAESHYLRIGVALQLIEGAHELDGSKALDAVIEIFSGRSTEELTKPAGRHKLKKELSHVLEESYHGEVMGVYFTEFVTQ
ncbi:flagellar basal body-associated FliL family protein [Nocardioides sp.]|uniref:flagellar basal body-associated FliL family protein n=1 Tax=Nocardioides sp. TaxID=35761 RepID=UPI00286A7AC5|nr:flagellar basal body-associated FliL family protein [Nocardioides sp.]